MSAPSANPTYKLYYFDVRALAEPIRFLFAYGNQKYDDIRVSKDDWPAMKPTFPLGQMPLLEVDGHRVHQSIPISRYVARRVGLAGKNEWEDLIIDIAVDTVNDLRLKIAAIHYEADEEVKQKKSVVLNTETIPFYLEKLDILAKENKGHFALGRLTWVDLYFVAVLDYVKFMTKPELIDNYPNLLAVVKNVLAVESIKSWVDKRPSSEL